MAKTCAAVAGSERVIAMPILADPGLEPGTLQL